MYHVWLLSDLVHELTVELVGTLELIGLVDELALYVLRAEDRFEVEPCLLHLDPDVDNLAGKAELVVPRTDELLEEDLKGAG